MGFFRNAGRAENCCPECLPAPCDPCEECVAVLTCRSASAAKEWCGFPGFLTDFDFCPTSNRFLTGVRHDLVRDRETGETTCETTTTQSFDRATCAETRVCVPMVGDAACEHCGFLIIPTTNTFPYSDTADSDTHNGGDDGDPDGYSEATLSDEYTREQFHSDVDAAVDAATYSDDMTECAASKSSSLCGDSIAITKLLYVIKTDPPNQCIRFKITFTPAGGGDPVVTDREEETDATGIFTEEIIPLASDPDGSWSVSDAICCP